MMGVVAMATVPTMAFLGGFGTWEILLVLSVILLFFGASRIPELARSLGKGVDEFKKGIQGGSGESRMRIEGQERIDDKDMTDPD
jgi:sec-independent protein translocase protein TatA